MQTNKGLFLKITLVISIIFFILCYLLYTTQNSNIAPNFWDIYKLYSTHALYSLPNPYLPISSLSILLWLTILSGWISWVLGTFYCFCYIKNEYKLSNGNYVNSLYLYFSFTFSLFFLMFSLIGYQVYAYYNSTNNTSLGLSILTVNFNSNWYLILNWFDFIMLGCLVGCWITYLITNYKVKTNNNVNDMVIPQPTPQINSNITPQMASQFQQSIPESNTVATDTPNQTLPVYHIDVNLLKQKKHWWNKKKTNIEINFNKDKEEKTNQN